MRDYVPSSVGYLDWPSPLQDRTLELDPFVEVELSGKEAVLHFASGDWAPLRFSIPAEGVLRIRIGNRTEESTRDSPLLSGQISEQPAQLGSEDGVLLIEGVGVSASWSAEEGLVFGKLRQVPPWSRPTVLGASGRIRLEDGIDTQSLTSGTRGVSAPQSRASGWMLMFFLESDARVYGGGESFQGPNLRGRIRRMVNCETNTYSGLDAAYINVPFLWSDAGWGIFFNTSAPSRADIASTHSEVIAVAVEEKELDLFLFSGDPATILRHYLSITGMPGSFPDWALGVWMSRCSYMTAVEIESTVDELHAAGCPVDVVHVDAWVSGNAIRDLACNWSIDRQRFPEGWVKRLTDRDVRVSLWHNPYVISGSARAEELERRGFLVKMPDGTLAVTYDKKDRNLIDFTNPAAVGWWKEKVTRVATEEGNSSFKPDFAEEVPEDAIFHDGRSGRELRNEYALLYQRATHEALREMSGDGRVALFCRSGTAGSQRYPCHWAGDTPSTWIGMATALRACLSLSLSGFGIVGHDVGGFYHPGTFEFDRLVSAFDTMDPSVFHPEVEPELFARWSQWGAFSPVMRFHGAGRREPTAYPEPARSVAIKACRTREALRDYLREAARIAAEEGLPMMRPMALAFPEDRDARAAELQYLLGSDILVAPVLEPGGRRTFYLPEGRWLGLVGLAPVEGPGWATVECELGQYPAFVREGAEWPLRR